MNNYKTLQVFLNERKVGTLAATPDYRVAFEYATPWLAEGFSISPLSLPLEKGVFMPKSYEPFEGLFGVFADSLPDGWGRLLLDRMLSREKINPAQISSLDRLAIVGSSGMGAMEYRPENELSLDASDLSLDELAMESEKIMESRQSDNLDEIFRLGGSSGGASATSALSIVPTLSGSTLGTASDCVICSSRGRPLSISSISMLFAPFQFLMYQAAWGHFPASPLCRTAGVLPAAG